MQTLLLNLNSHAIARLRAERYSYIRITLGGDGCTYIKPVHEEGENHSRIWRKGRHGRSASCAFRGNVGVTMGILPGFRYTISDDIGVYGYRMEVVGPIPLPGEPGHKKRFDQPIISVTERCPPESGQSDTDDPATTHKEIRRLNENVAALCHIVAQMNRNVSIILSNMEEQRDDARAVALNLKNLNGVIQDVLGNTVPLPTPQKAMVAGH